MRRYSRILSALGLLALVTGGPVMASTVTGATFRGQVNVVNSSFAKANAVIPFTINTQNMIDGKYILNDCSDIALQDSTNGDIPFMPAPGAGTTWMVFVDDIQQNMTKNYYLYTGGTTSGGKLRYFPAAGGMSVADAAGLELGSGNFEIEVKGFVDTSSGSNKYLVNKAGALILKVSASGTVLFEEYAAAAGTDQTYNTGSSQEPISGANWYAQSFTTGSQQLLHYVQLYCYGTHSGTPAGSTTVSIYATDGSGRPTGSALGSVSLADSSITASQFNTWTFASPIYLANATKYTMVVSDPTATGSNHWHWGFNISGGYANGSYWASTDSGINWTETAGADFRFLTNATAAAQIIATGQTSGEYDYKINRTGSTITLYDGVDSLGTATAITVLNNASNWLFFENGSMPYLELAKITAGSTLKGSWAWENSATFTDLSGNSNTATPTFATTANVADVAASLVSFLPLNPSSGGLPTTSAAPEFPITFPSETRITDVSQSGITNIPVVGNLIYNYLIDHNIPIGLVTYPFMMASVVIVVFLAYWKPKDIWWPSLAALATFGLFIKWGLLPWAVLFLEAIWIAFCFVKRGGMSRA